MTRATVLILSSVLLTFSSVSLASSVPIEVSPISDSVLRVSWDAGAVDGGTPSVTWRETVQHGATNVSAPLQGDAGVFDIVGLRPATDYEVRLRIKDDGDSDPVVARTLSRDEALRSSPAYQLLDRDGRVDLNHVVISAVKQIAGADSTNEWVSVQLKFGGNHKRSGVWSYLRPFNVSYFDINLAPDDEEATDILNDATVSLNWILDPANAGSPRTTYLGPTYKFLGGSSYYGVQLGCIEGARSDFFGSYLAGGAIKEWKSQRWEGYLEFTLRSDSGPSFFKTFAVHGSIRIDEDGNTNPRITLLVPLGGVHGFE